MTGNSLTLHIDSAPEGQTIAGRFRDGRGEEHLFTGWLGLLTLLEEARRTAVAQAASRPAGLPGDTTKRLPV